MVSESCTSAVYLQAPQQPS